MSPTLSLERKPTSTLRREAGLWLKKMREERGLSQRQMANQLQLEYYTFISQLENGRGRIPQYRYRDWAEVLGVDASTFARELLAFYDPEAYELLFSDGVFQK